MPSARVASPSPLTGQPTGAEPFREPHGRKRARLVRMLRGLYARLLQVCKCKCSLVQRARMMDAPDSTPTVRDCVHPVGGSLCWSCVITRP